MKATGIIAEYNPFHNGHKYHIQKAREITQAEVVIVVMSGNFLQRGEPAILDKWQRAAEALQNGADLVVELPIQWSLQAADFFGHGAVKLLAALGCESICFGTDTVDPIDYEKLGQTLIQSKAELEAAFFHLDDPKLTYAQKMALVLNQVLPEFAISADQPNHLLGLSYAKANANLATPLKLYSVRRKGASHHDDSLNAQIASATAIRQAVRNGHTVDQVVPMQTASDLQRRVISWDDYWIYLKYKIQSSSLAELSQIYQMSEGLEYRLKEQVNEAKNMADFIERIKSKRYSRTKIQRLLCYVLLAIKETEMQAAWTDNALHILGFTPTGQSYMNEQKKSFTLPVFSKIGKKEAERFPLMVKTDRIYQLGDPQIEEQSFGRYPLKVQNEK